MEPTTTYSPVSQIADQCERDQLRRYLRHRRLVGDIQEATRLEDARRRLEVHLRRFLV